MGGGLVIDHLPNKCEALCLISSPTKTSEEWREREESNREKKGERRRRGKNGKREGKEEKWGMGERRETGSYLSNSIPLWVNAYSHDCSKWWRQWMFSTKQDIYSTPSKAQGTLQNKDRKKCKCKKSGRRNKKSYFLGMIQLSQPRTHNSLQLPALGSHTNEPVNSQAWMKELKGLLPLPAELLATDIFWDREVVAFSCISTTEPIRITWVLLP